MQNLIMDASSTSFQVTSPFTNYSPTVIGGDLTNEGYIGNGNIGMASDNYAKGGDLSMSIPMMPFLNLDSRRRALPKKSKSKKARLAILLV